MELLCLLIYIFLYFVIIDCYFVYLLIFHSFFNHPQIIIASVAHWFFKINFLLHFLIQQINYFATLNNSASLSAAQCK